MVVLPVVTFPGRCFAVSSLLLGSPVLQMVSIAFLLASRFLALASVPGGSGQLASVSSFCVVLSVSSSHN